MTEYVLSRDIINEDTVLIQEGTRYTKSDLVDIIDRWHTVLSETDLKKGDYFMTLDGLSIEMFTLLITGCERGLVFFNANRVYIDRESIINNQKFFDRPSLVFHTRRDSIASTVTNHWDASRVMYVPEITKVRKGTRPSIEVTATDIALMTLTSGTTGNPSRVTHTHKGLTGEAFLKKGILVKPGDTFLASNLINHIGIFISTTLPAIHIGAEIIFNLNDWEDYTLSMLDESTTSTVVFECIIDKVASKLDTMGKSDLSHLDRVLTGGKVLSKDFALRLLRDLGIREIINVYGSSECSLVASQSVTLDNIDEVFESGHPYLTNIPDHIEIRTTDEGLLKIKTDFMSIDSSGDGFIHLGDRGRIEDGKLYVMERGERWGRINDTLVNLTELEISIMDIEELEGLRVQDLRLFIENDELYLLLDSLAGEIDLSKINRVLTDVAKMTLRVRRYGFQTPEAREGSIKKTWSTNSYLCPFE